MIEYKHLTIPFGGMYQKWCHIIDLVEEDTAKYLEKLAQNKGWRLIQPDEAEYMGFEELVDWSLPETDVMVLIDERYLVCLLKKDFYKN